MQEINFNLNWVKDTGVITIDDTLPLTKQMVFYLDANELNSLAIYLDRPKEVYHFVNNKFQRIVMDLIINEIMDNSTIHYIDNVKGDNFEELHNFIKDSGYNTIISPNYDLMQSSQFFIDYTFQPSSVFYRKGFMFDTEVYIYHGSTDKFLLCNKNQILFNFKMEPIEHYRPDNFSHLMRFGIKLSSTMILVYFSKKTNSWVRYIVEHRSNKIKDILNKKEL